MVIVLCMCDWIDGYGYGISKEVYYSIFKWFILFYLIFNEWMIIIDKNKIFPYLDLSILDITQDGQNKILQL